MNKILLSVLISFNLYGATNYCKNDFLTYKKNIIVKSGSIFMDYDSLKISKEILFNRPFDKKLILEFLDLNKDKFNFRILKTIEIAYLFKTDNKVKSKITEYYLNHFEKIKKEYIEKPSSLRIFILKDMNIVKKEDLDQFLNNVDIVKVRDSFYYYNAIKNNEKIKVDLENFEYICMNPYTLNIKRNQLSALDLSKLYLQSKENINAKYLFFSIANKDIYFYYKYLDTKDLIYLYKITKDIDLVPEIATNALDNQKIFKSYVYSKIYFNYFKNKSVTKKELYKINKLREIISISGEDIANKFLKNKDFVNYNKIRKEIHFYSKMIFRLKDI